MKAKSSKKHSKPQPAVGSRKAGRAQRDANFLPPHIGSSFQRELVDLVDQLAKDGGFKEQYLADELLSKYNGPGTVSPDERVEAALNKWLSTEKRNSRTNERIQLGDVDFGFTSSDDILSFARAMIAKILGRLHYPSTLFGSCHTNGASTRVRRSVVAAAEKSTGKAHASSSALPHWTRIALNTRLEEQTVELKETSVWFTVPKNSEIDRAACKEPEVNMFLQRAVGAHIRRRLKRYGVDLNDQTVNQKLASEALTRGLATIDLSAASDSITRQLVFELLPFEWWSLLDDLRVHQTLLPDGRVHDLEMFSSMGNGFTFELESLIFWALARSIARATGTRGRISVYGDDIICPSALAPPLVQLFGWFGFKVNTKKSFWSGPFRESCGKHYHRSLDVTPFYIREPVKRKTDVIRLLNRLLQWDGRGWGFFLNFRVASFHRKWSQAIPAYLHGGQDIDAIDALVTGDGPRRRLMRDTRKMTREEAGAYNHWFTVKEGSRPSRLSYDDGSWSYPDLRAHMTDFDGEQSPFEVSSDTAGRYYVSTHKQFVEDEAVQRERTAWTPYLIWSAAQCDPIA